MGWIPIKKNYRQITLGLMLVATCFSLAFWAYSHYFQNKAEVKFHRIFANLNELNPKLICAYGWNNAELQTIPWFYNSYYSTDNPSDLVQKLQQMAAKSGYTLNLDTKEIQSSKNLSGYNEQTYLIAYSGASVLKVDISQQGQSLDNLCTGSKSYGQKYLPAPGKALIEFDFSLG